MHPPRVMSVTGVSHATRRSRIRRRQAGLPTAEEQADAAFADLLETSRLYGPQSEGTHVDIRFTLRDREKRLRQETSKAEGETKW